MNTITRVYELLDDRALSLTKLAEMSGVAYSTIKMAKAAIRSSVWIPSSESVMRWGLRSVSFLQSRRRAKGGTADGTF